MHPNQLYYSLGLKTNHISCHNDGAFIFALGIVATSLFLTGQPGHQALEVRCGIT
jgi:hypothetical protein